ncbi:hypothetical protein ACQ4PT_028438 [Festuca glaucescens]
MVAANGGQEIPSIQVWQTTHKKKELVEGKVMYYSKIEVSVESYKKGFKSLRGEDSNPLSERLDEMVVMISGAFRGSDDWCSAATGYEEGARGEEGEEDGYEEGGRGEEGEEGEHVPGKALWVCGSATLPDAPKTEEGKLVVYVEKPEALGLVGKRRNKDRVIAENLTIEDDAGWERICPPWCVNKKDGWCALVRYWTEDEEFKAKSIQNKANRGKGGTHNQGNKPFPLYEKDMVAANGGQEIPRIQVWQTAHKKKELVEGKVVYYGKIEVSVESYKKAFKSLRREDSDPLSE